MLREKQHPQVGFRKEARGKDARRRQGSARGQQVQEKALGTETPPSLPPAVSVSSGLLALGEREDWGFLSQGGDKVRTFVQY